MHLQQTQKPSTFLPFALQSHESALEKDEVLLGNPEQEWTWKPIGDLKPENLAIYASGGNSTTQKTGVNQWDSGEFQ